MQKSTLNQEKIQPSVLVGVIYESKKEAFTFYSDMSMEDIYSEIFRIFKLNVVDFKSDCCVQMYEHFRENQTLLLEKKKSETKKKSNHFNVDPISQMDDENFSIHEILDQKPLETSNNFYFQEKEDIISQKEFIFPFEKEYLSSDS